MAVIGGQGKRVIYNLWSYMTLFDRAQARASCCQQVLFNGGIMDCAVSLPYDVPGLFLYPSSGSGTPVLFLLATMPGEREAR